MNGNFQTKFCLFSLVYYLYGQRYVVQTRSFSSQYLIQSQLCSFLHYDPYNPAYYKVNHKTIIRVYGFVLTVLCQANWNSSAGSLIVLA